MSLKTRLRIAIVALVAVVVIALSGLYLDDFTTLAFEAAATLADLVGNQVKGYVLERVEQQSRPANLEESKIAWTEIVRTDPLIAAMLQRTLANADVVIEIDITGEDGRLLVASPPRNGSHAAQSAIDFKTVEGRNALSNLWDLFTKRENYSRTIPLGVAGQQRPLFQIEVMIRSTLLWRALRPGFLNLAIAFLASLGAALFLASALPHFILNPLERLSRRIDLIRTGEFAAQPGPPHQETREFAAVQSKLNLLGQQYQGAKQDAVQLRSNVEEMLQRLEEAVLLFDSSGRLMMAGQPAERLLGRPRSEMLGRQLEELFPRSSILGAVLAGAIQRHQPLHDAVIAVDRDVSTKIRLLVNLETLVNSGMQSEIGTLITLRDAESRRQLGLQLEVSTRLAAISRLTAGVAHEIKNPLNAMALHLEVLKSRFDAAEPEIDVISKEIKRLDNVVKTFLNFNKPVEVQAKPLDLTILASEVADLISPEARSKGVTVETHLDAPHWINGDTDLLKQAVVNVVVNAVEAMDGGGRVVIATEDAGADCAITVADSGPGIPPEVQDKIFNLYFSTKKSGSGIGLAMTFRVVQLLSGTIDFSSEQGKGTSFRLRFPSLSTYKGPPAVNTAHT